MTLYFTILLYDLLLNLIQGVLKVPNNQAAIQAPRVTVDINDDVAIVTLNRGRKYNALDMDMFYALDNTATELANNKAIRAVIVRGDG